MHRLPLLAVASALVILTGCKVLQGNSLSVRGPARGSHSAHKNSHSSATAARDPKSDAHPAGIGTGPLRPRLG
jgi:hypothetical protein